jgi:hypothetical protein
MNDVTNLRNGDLSSTKKLEYKPMVFSSWSVKHDNNVESCRQQGVATLEESGDQVVITKVVTNADKNHGRQSHPRKAPIEVRKLYLDDKTNKTEVSTVLERDANCNGKRAKKYSLQDIVGSSAFNGNINGTPWSFTSSPDKPICHINNSFREDKIKNLKDRLVKQQEAVEKLRVTSSTITNGSNRVLVVKIPDLKSKLDIRTEKKQSFRVIEQSDPVKTKNNDMTNKRKRKTLPRKVSREQQYPSYATNRLPATHDPDDTADLSYVPHKKTRVRVDEESTYKQRLPRRRRGRSSPHNGKQNQIPVATKDLWHREMERVEAELALSNQPIDKTSFMLFLGLRKVEKSCTSLDT